MWINLFYHDYFAAIVVALTMVVGIFYYLYGGSVHELKTDTNKKHAAIPYKDNTKGAFFIPKENRWKTRENVILYNRLRKNQLNVHENLKKGADPKIILFYNPATYQLSRNIRKWSTLFFRNCEIKNCVMRFNRSLASKSDAVILTSWMPASGLVKRPGQVWIMLQWESPLTHRTLASPTAPAHLKNQINWTMSYSRNSDIYLPYGRFRRVPKRERSQRNYYQIAKQKSRDAVWIVSHCNTDSKREIYVEILKEYISVDIFGECGKKWECGRRLIHNHCFDMLNTTYRYYLAFENSICKDYITEKFFENYKYDILQVVRGDNPFQRPINISPEAYISASDFKNPHELGQYLKSLSSNPSKYASMLRTKDEYEAVPYIELFRDAACEICKRIHSVEKYNSLYPDVNKWMQENEACVEPEEIYTLI